MATVPGNVAALAAVEVVPDPPIFVQPEARTTTELVPSLADSVAKARQALGGFDDARMGAMRRLQSGAISPIAADYARRADGRKAVRNFQKSQARQPTPAATAIRAGTVVVATDEVPFTIRNVHSETIM